jgi:hypothetical protein
MNHEYKKRGYLLPHGCKDLIDVVKLPASVKPLPAFTQYSPLSLVIGEVTVAGPMTVRELASVLKRKPFQIIADLIQLGVMANVDQQISLEIIARVARKYGYVAKI